jgi:hypothetical protein
MYRKDIKDCQGLSHLDGFTRYDDYDTDYDERKQTERKLIYADDYDDLQDDEYLHDDFDRELKESDSDSQHSNSEEQLSLQDIRKKLSIIKQPALFEDSCEEPRARRKRSVSFKSDDGDMIKAFDSSSKFVDEDEEFDDIDYEEYNHSGDYNEKNSDFQKSILNANFSRADNICREKRPQNYDSGEERLSEDYEEGKNSEQISRRHSLYDNDEEADKRNFTRCTEKTSRTAKV